MTESSTDIFARALAEKERRDAEAAAKADAAAVPVTPEVVTAMLEKMRTKPTGEIQQSLIAAVGKYIMQTEAQDLYEQATNPVGPLQLVTEADVQARPAPEWWIDGLLQKGTIAVFAGEAGIGKTFTSIHASRCIATGARFFGRDVRKGTVLYVAAEGASAFGSRVRAWDDYHHLTPDPGSINYLESGVDLMNTSSVDRLIELLDTLQPDLIILDTLSQLASIENENDAGKMSQVFRVAKRLRDRKADSTVLFIHHVNKGSGGVRGSSVIRSNVDTVIVAKGEGSGGFYLSTELSDNGKQKDGVAEKVPGFSLTSHGPSAVVTWSNKVAPDVDLEAIQDLFSDGLTHSKREAMHACGVPKAEASDSNYKRFQSKWRKWVGADGILFQPAESKDFQMLGIAQRPAAPQAA